MAEFDKYTEPMKDLLGRLRRASARLSYVVSSAHPRMVDGKPSKNPRYLQKRPDLENPRETYLAEIAARLEREIPAGPPVHFPVNAVLAGRRNSPPDPEIGLPPLAVYNPIHYQELPELFMEFVSSLTGKSPSTTGFGSEGALTKVSLQRALARGGSEQRAGVRDPHRLRRIHHFGWLRGPARARGPRHQHAGSGDLVPHARPRARPAVPDSRRACSNESRISRSTAARFSPAAWDTASRRCSSTVSWGGFSKRPTPFSPRRCCGPEKQGLEMFAAGVDAIVEAQRRVALNYFEDGSVEAACPPLKALLHIMAHGEYEGMGLDDPEVSRAVRARSGARKRLVSGAALRASRSATSRCGGAMSRRSNSFRVRARRCADRRISIWRNASARRKRKSTRVSSPAYLDELRGTIGADPFHRTNPAIRRRPAIPRRYVGVSSGNTSTETCKR